MSLKMEKGRLKDRFESFEIQNTFCPQEHLPQVDKAHGVTMNLETVNGGEGYKYGE